MAEEVKKGLGAKRRESRRVVLQLLYRWQLDESMSRHGFQDMMVEHHTRDADMDYVQRLFLGVTEQLTAIDEAIKPSLDRSLQSVGQVERLVLRLATYELMDCVEVPYRVIINEAIELVKEFGPEEGYRYVNGVLDKLAPTLRQAEMSD